MAKDVTRAQELQARRALERAANWMDRARWWSAGVGLLAVLPIFGFAMSHIGEIDPVRSIRLLIYGPACVVGAGYFMARPFQNWVSDILNRQRTPLIWATILCVAAAITTFASDGYFFFHMSGDTGDVLQQRIIFGLLCAALVGFSCWASIVFRGGWKAAVLLTGDVRVEPTATVTPAAARRRASQKRVDRMGQFVERLPWTFAMLASPFAIAACASAVNLLIPLTALITLVLFRSNFESAGERLRSRDRTAAIWAGRVAIGWMVLCLAVSVATYFLMVMEGLRDGALWVALMPAGGAVAALVLERKLRQVVRDVDDLMEHRTGGFDVLAVGSTSPTEAIAAEASASPAPLLPAKPVPAFMPPRPKR